MIELSRGRNAIETEVQRWQFFLQRNGFTEIRKVDADFGQKTEDATRRFQQLNGLPQSGALDRATIEVARQRGYTVMTAAHYTDPVKQGDSWPPRPRDLASPSNAARNRALTCFTFDMSPEGERRTDATHGINIKGSCDGSHRDWIAEFIVDVPTPAALIPAGFPRFVRFHRRVAPFLARMFEAWERADLLHLLISYSGDFVPRYTRNTRPPPEGHGLKNSNQARGLSNHAFGSAFDVNVPQNDFREIPAFIGKKGCVRELVAIANAEGFFWGGHFTSPRDGMHFEFADFSRL